MEEKAQEQRQTGIPAWILVVVVVIIIGLAIFLFLTRGVTVEGTIQDAIKGTPVVGATITAGNSSTTSDKNGNFRLRVPKLEGEITVNAPGYEPLSTSLDKRLSLSLVPLPEKVASYWFEFWKENNYDGMYNLLTSNCQNAVSREIFQQEFSRYQLEIMDVRTQQTGTEGDTANVSAEVDINTPLGKQTLHFSLQLHKEGGLWKVVWYRGGQGIAPSQPPL